MRFYNYLKRKPIKQSKKHQGKINPDSGRWMPGVNTSSVGGTPDARKATDQRAQIYKN